MLKTASALGRATLVVGLLAAIPVAAQTKVKTKVKKGATTTAAPADKSNASLRYTLAMPAPQTHYFEVKMELRGFDREYTDIKMPVWAPGSYLVREFARHVERLQATAGGQPLAVEKLDKTPGVCATPSKAASR